MKEHQTPRKDISHRRPKDSPSSKSISDQAKKPPKVAKKSLNAEFSSVSEDLLTESVTESFNFSSVSEILTDNHIVESSDSFESLIGLESYSISTLEEALTPSDSTPCSKITTVNDELIDLSLDRNSVFRSNGSDEVELVGNLLKQARFQVLSSSDIQPKWKKLLDALIEVSVKEFYCLPVETEQIDVLISEKRRVLVLCFAVMLMITVNLMIYVGGLESRSSSSYYLRPT